MSNGGGFTGLLACDPTTSARIAAFSTVSGAFYLGVLGASSDSLPDCNPARKPIPLLHFHGYADTQIPYNGGESHSHQGKTTSIPDYLDRWAQIDGIQPDQDPSDLCDGKVKRHSWGNGVLQHYNETELEHTWPSKSPNDSDKSGKFETCYEGAQVIMDFFGNYSL
jgi:poly(3-hydroxybutyrate) depolymerase